MKESEIKKADVSTKLELPMYDAIAAGFPITGDYVAERLDFNRDFIKHPESTFYVWVRGDSMKDAGICQFETMAYGWRAAFVLLTRTYYHTYRLYTIRAIISRWAPPNENNTRAYIENVARLTGITPDEPLGIPSEKPSRWIAVGAAMAIQECGKDGFDQFAMLRGWEMARG